LLATNTQDGGRGEAGFGGEGTEDKGKCPDIGSEPLGPKGGPNLSRERDGGAGRGKERSIESLQVKREKAVA